VTGWIGNIEAITLGNSTFRTVLFTGSNLQLTVMSLQPGEEIGLEMHDHRDQFLRVEDGDATVTLGPSQDEVDETHQLTDDWAVIVPGGTWHNVINTGDTPLRLYSLYGPPEHPDRAVHRTKAEADAAEAEHDS
jgi:mannose-6-phosphate isomerase-like protein (cupin superfamily)